MTKASIDHIKQKQIQLRQEELEQKRLEKEEKIRKEKERQQEKLRRLSSSENFGIETLSINGSSSSPSPAKTSPPKPLPPAITPKKIKTENKPVSSSPMSAQYPPPTDSDNPEDWKPVRDPDAVLKDALKKLSQDDWDVKCDGINKIRQLSLHHSDVIQAQLHTVTVAINAEVKNLRSQVSRLAICCLGELFANLKRGMDPDLDSTTRTLLAKNAESNGFIKQDVEKALENMIDNVSPPRALTALILGGAGHKSNPVRKMTAQFLVELTEKMGPGRILSGIKDITDKILPTAAKFIQDGSPETRYYGRKILYTLMSHQDFEKMLNKHVNSTTIRNIQETLDSLKQKGLGDMPNETPSAKSRRSGHGSRSNSTVRGNSANSANGNNNTPLPRRRTVKTDAATLDEINQMIDMMSASNWNDRYNALKDFLVLCEANPDQVAPHIVKIFDKFSPRLVDSNSKVNLFALQVMFQVIPLLKDSLPQGPVLNIAIGNVVPNLSSKNRDIHEAAANILEALIEHIDACQLIEPFANQAIAAGPRSKPEIVEKVAYLVQKVYVKKQKLVILRVLPLLWHLLVASNSSGAVHGGSCDLRTASAQLANVLYSNMGTSLIDKAQADPNITPRHVEFLNQLLDR
ncbi:TOG array regulator of axonemal microtubules protein 1 [Patella vulgata]|uniref:TOG array regulator of axonemal microtubules protein 1 n=1 Tax=Patella vulgata TaxID=6465 RepID=UPI0024A8012D|nr:TOG array regulator of axonemal microtubules protein 1 [Patella vulgata]